MKITEYIQNHITVLDGAMGTMLQKEGMAPGVLPETLNLTAPDRIRRIHQAYFDAGANIVIANTFGANSLKFSAEELERIVSAALGIAREAAHNSIGKQAKFVALDIGPSGRMLAPYGDLPFEEAVSVFANTVRLGVKYGADLIFIETMNDLYETKAALLAAKENSGIPVFVSNAYGEDGKLLTGASPAVTVSLLESMGADVIGVNCSLGPKALAPVVNEYLKYASVPVLVKPNAGLPRDVDGKTVYDVSPEDFSEAVHQMVSHGVRCVGGCCGTTPDFIRKLADFAKDTKPVYTEEKNDVIVTSFATAVCFDTKPRLIGERINPTGKKRFQQALRENDIPFLLAEAVSQQEKGAEILDVNVGLPGIDEAQLLKKAVQEIQTVTDLPLQIDTSDPIAMEQALRVYNGKAMINSVNGKPASMHAIFPLLKKYGGVAVALTLDENGIPETAEGRLSVAKKILETAERYGIKKKNIIFDPLAMAVSAAPEAANIALRAIRMIREETGCKTVMGVSNISFGLPERANLNAVFFTLAMQAGLSAAIMNPGSLEMTSAYRSYLALRNLDPDFSGYLQFGAERTTEKTIEPRADSLDLQTAVIKGMKTQAAKLTEELLRSRKGLDIINTEIIPALNTVGLNFERKTIFLPQLLISAETAAAAFEVIKSHTIDEGDKPKHCAVVLLTVKGDIHDIGKNIVKLLLQNFGFDVTDLGKDVRPEEAVDAVCRLHAPIIGMSALMTTTVPAMRDTITLLREKAPWCKIIVGGAVLTEEYAAQIGADKYAPDAMETVRYATEIDKEWRGSA